jgi:hypothetical protein
MSQIGALTPDYRVNQLFQFSKLIADRLRLLQNRLARVSTVST